MSLSEAAGEDRLNSYALRDRATQSGRLGRHDQFMLRWSGKSNTWKNAPSSYVQTLLIGVFMISNLGKRSL